MIFDADDQGCNRVISDMCQSHDARDVLIQLHKTNPKFKATLFTIPGETTLELVRWAIDNNTWVELAFHGFFHTSNYECEKMSYAEFDMRMAEIPMEIAFYFVKGFKAPGWQISDDIYKWLLDNDYWIADQEYNTARRPQELKAYVNDNNNFRVWTPGVGYGAYLPATHHHTWDTVGNGVYEQFDYLMDLVKNTNDWKFVSEVVHAG